MARQYILFEINSGAESRPETCGIPLAHIRGPEFFYTVRQNRTFIGTSRVRGVVDILLTNLNISARHIEIVFDCPKFLLFCHGQTGVYVNGVWQRPGAPPCQRENVKDDSEPNLVCNLDKSVHLRT
jgi:hypothetical protein